MTESLAPIVLFVYNRLEHTKRTVEALQKNDLAKDSELFIFSDAPKHEMDIAKVQVVREYLHLINGFKKLTIVERTENYGLAKSIIEGVTEIISKYGKVIVLEDDLITERSFLKYMNGGLNLYRHNPHVFTISGYSYVGKRIDERDTYFLKISTSWSWATWKDRWCKFDVLCTGWEELKVNKVLRREFDYDYSYPYYELLINQMERKKNNSWAIKWYWTIFINEGLTLFPALPLVHNEGFDGSGENCGIEYQKKVNNSKIQLVECLKYDATIQEDIGVRKKVAKAIRKNIGLGERIQLLKDIIM